MSVSRPEESLINVELLQSALLFTFQCVRFESLNYPCRDKSTTCSASC